MKRKLAVLAVVAGLLPGAAAAHHSFAMFNRDQLTSITGVVKDYEWSNPHVWIHLMVTDDKGVPHEWGFEMQSIAQDSRAGWRPDSVKPGDKVTIEFHPLKDGSRGGELLAAVVPDGRRLGSSATRPAPGR